MAHKAIEDWLLHYNATTTIVKMYRTNTSHAKYDSMYYMIIIWLSSKLCKQRFKQSQHGSHFCRRELFRKIPVVLASFRSSGRIGSSFHPCCFFFGRLVKLLWPKCRWWSFFHLAHRYTLGRQWVQTPTVYQSHALTVKGKHVSVRKVSKVYVT